MNLLVTAGATREPIDAVRFLTNVSSGATGAALADALEALGHSVTLLRGEGAAGPREVRDVETFFSAKDLIARLKRRLADGKFDGIVMAAAVADYRPDAAFAGKLASDEELVTVRLVRNEKVLPQLKSFAPRPLTVIGFKLTVGAAEAARRAAVAAQFDAGGVDAVVQNDLEEIRRETEHPFRLYPSADASPIESRGAVKLAASLERVFNRSL
jgi:phosphopantothenoylcysteine decarboxylase/phosphopantothenate--cysteine ligase